jgi:hypothetical protein
MSDVETFCTEKGLTERVDLIKRGALVAQNPTGYDHIETLSEPEREALRFEAAHRWRHPLSLYFTIIVCSIGAAVQGWVRTCVMTNERVHKLTLCRIKPARTVPI